MITQTPDRATLAQAFAIEWLRKLERTSKMTVSPKSPFVDRIAERAVDLGVIMADRMLRQLAETQP